MMPLLQRAFRTISLLMAALLLPAAFVHADDAALYGPVAPPGSAFVRMVNASDAAGVDARVGNESLSGLAPWEVSEFVFVPAGPHTLDIGARKLPAVLQAGHYYTAVARAAGVTLFDNARYSNRTRALIVLYNLTPQAVSLRTADGRAVVVADVAAQQFGLREVNPARVTLAVFAGDTQLAVAPPLGFVRGKAHSLFVVGSPGAPRLIWATN